MARLSRLVHVRLQLTCNPRWAFTHGPIRVWAILWVKSSMGNCSGGSLEKVTVISGGHALSPVKLQRECHNHAGVGA